MWIKHILYREYLFWPLFLMSQSFCMYEILRFCKFLGSFCKSKIHMKWFQIFCVYFDLKSLLFIKINPCKTPKPLHLWKLAQAKILYHKCSEEPKKLVCNTMSFFSWANYNVKNVLLFFNSKLKTSCKKRGTGSCPFQCCLLMLIHLGAFYTGAIFNSIAKKILPKEINSSPLRKSFLKKSHLWKGGQAFKCRGEGICYICK